MAVAFRAANMNLPPTDPPVDHNAMATSPTTPRPSTAPQYPDANSKMESEPIHDATTPTRSSFSSAVTGQRPLPSSPFPQGVQIPEMSDRSKRADSQHSKDSRRDSMDITMEDSDEEHDDAGSDDESVNADGSKSGKKKKSQRFFCNDYPPCNLSFTRSEHLARHIRKHTGERPFQCHCSRRFSRLDNLRQHAQTVHINEDIPMDSLAATGSRFQRQMRTERVRQAGNRARAATSGSAGGPPRGHSKSLSTSSITSVSSVGSAYSQIDARRRPPPLVMAADPRQRASLDSYRSNAGDSTFSSYRPPSPSDFSTPTSATFSTGQNSPRWGMSPSSHSRSQSMYITGTRTPGRRLSVPSGANPFQTFQGFPGRTLFSPGSINSSHAATFSAASSSMMSSPTASSSGFSARRDSTSSNADEAWRRRTWHPDSHSFSGQLSSVNESAVQTHPPPPIATPSQAQSNLRLPGIESFDPIPGHRPATPPRRNPSPMIVDEPPPPRSALQLSGGEPHDRRNLNMYDAGLQRGLTRLDIGPNTPPRDSAGTWASEVNKAVMAQAEQVRVANPGYQVASNNGFIYDDRRPTYQDAPMTASRVLHQQTMSAPSTATTREGKRHGWYNGPQREPLPQGPPVQQHPDPRAAHVERMVHPNINVTFGFPAREQPPQPQPPQQHPANGEPLGRLEALVAVATGEGSTAKAY